MGVNHGKVNGEVPDDLGEWSAKKVYPEQDRTSGDDQSREVKHDAAPAVERGGEVEGDNHNGRNGSADKTARGISRPAQTDLTSTESRETKEHPDRLTSPP